MKTTAQVIVETMQRRVSNLLFHIENNGDVLGPKQTLKDIEAGLKSINRDCKEMLGGKN